MFFFDYIFPKAPVTPDKNAPNIRHSWHNLTLENIVFFLLAKQLPHRSLQPFKGFLSHLSNLQGPLTCPKIQRNKGTFTRYYDPWTYQGKKVWKTTAVRSYHCSQSKKFNQIICLHCFSRRSSNIVKWLENPSKLHSGQLLTAAYRSKKLNNWVSDWPIPGWLSYHRYSGFQYCRPLQPCLSRVQGVFSRSP